MIPKRIQTAAWSWGQPSINLLHVFSKGFDSDQLQKIAADLTLAELNITPKKGKEYLHIITTGAGETYGANSNADWFNESAHKFNFPHAKEASASRMLDGGLSKYHSTYRQLGGVYRNHNNSRKGFEKEGEVLWEQYNTDMHRGEVVVELPAAAWRDDLEKVANGEHVPFSMGAGIPQDYCSWCGHAAKTRKQYCDCLKFNKLALDKEGNQCFAINDQPHFHDISRVTVPSEKIALVLAKVASEGTSIDVVDMFMKENAASLYLPLSVIRQLATDKEANRVDIIEKLAAMEKEVQAEGNDVIENAADAFLMNKDEEDKVVSNCSKIPIEQLLSALSKENMMLTPNSFVRIVLSKEPAALEGVSGFEDALKSVFSDLKDNADPETILQDGSYAVTGRSPSVSAIDTVKRLSDLLSLNEEPVRKRIIKITISGKPKGSEKEASVDGPSTGAMVLAREYAKYQLSFLASANKPENLQLAIASNYAG